MPHDADDEIDLDAINDPQLRQLLENLDQMPEGVRDRFVRLAERVAALPAEVQANMTPEAMAYMLENDVDYPFN